ncbi:MAG: hypothetical protein WCL27_18360, partial [Betaproteobacteria bacterium]
MFKNNLQARFTVVVSAFVIVVVLGGALFFSSIENRRINSEVTAANQQKVQGVMQILGVTDALMIEQAHASMRLLIERGKALGEASLGGTVEVKDKSVPELLLGGKG